MFASGIGYALDPGFSFAKIAAPYAQVPYLCIAILRLPCQWFGRILLIYTLYAGTFRFKTEAAYWDTACERNKETSR